MTIKDDDGTEIKLSILETPIDFDSLQYRNEIESVEETKKLQKFQATDDPNIANVILLQKPISLDDIEWGNKNRITINVKTVKGTYLRQRKREKAKMEVWQENALAIFEHSHVYPFIHASNKYKCFLCAKLFLDAEMLKEHSNLHSVEEYQKELRYSLKDRGIKVDVTSLMCKICEEAVSNLNALKMHLKSHGKDVDVDCKDNLIPYKLGGDTFQCQICSDDFMKLRLLVIHMSKHYNNYSCEICGSVFISLRLLKTHQKTHVRGNFPCERCDKVFSSSMKMQQHLRGVHLKQMPRRCPICPERFKSNYQRTKHLRLVHNQTAGLFRCETCGREYDLKYHLRKHIRSVHLQERNEECHICHSRFFSKNCLTRHMVIHTGEKNFKCELCGKAYARRRNLSIHFKTHEPAQSICDICGQNCGSHTSFVAHLNSVHGVL